jgi:hypothetical protein
MAISGDGSFISDLNLYIKRHLSNKAILIEFITFQNLINPPEKTIFISIARSN